MQHGSVCFGQIDELYRLSGWQRVRHQNGKPQFVRGWQILGLIGHSVHRLWGWHLCDRFGDAMHQLPGGVVLLHRRDGLHQLQCWLVLRFVHIRACSLSCRTIFERWSNSVRVMSRGHICKHAGCAVM